VCNSVHLRGLRSLRLDIGCRADSFKFNHNRTLQVSDTVGGTSESLGQWSVTIQ
jgi:hypothetical protein